jgi:beta-galactosidase
MLGVCYYPEHWPEDVWEDDARRMAELGLAYVRIGEFAWSRIEPEPGRFDWAWLDRAVNVLGRHGLKIVMGTPTATPPKWLVDAHPDILPVDASGKVRGFGSRRHYSFSSKTYWEESRRIVEAIARRYGRHDAVAGWQTDNEYGCHNTVLSWGPADLEAFRGWLRGRYQTPEALNAAWGNVFWSQEVRSFDEIALPALAVTETNPAARLDFRRFASEQVAAYDRMQVGILREHSPGRFITHNFMGFFREFDHWAFDHLDFASWDSYPLGFLEHFPFADAERERWALTSHPDIGAFHHDLYRGIRGNRFWVMEQQPGPVNWASWNPVPQPGMVRLWTWEALAHGAEVVSYFRWRQAPFAQEQMHAGLNRPDRTLSPGGMEAAQVARELASLKSLPETRQAPVALVFDYEASWITEIQPQGRDFSYAELAFRWYEALRRFGLDIDIVPPGRPLHGYRAVVVPTLPHLSDAALAVFEATDAPILFGPRSGSKTRHFGIPLQLPPGPLQALLPLKIIQVSSLRPGLSAPVEGNVQGAAERWREWVETDLEPTARFADGTPALVEHDSRFYLAAWPDADLLRAVLRLVLGERAGLLLKELPAHIRVRRRGDLAFTFNYGPQPWSDAEAQIAGGKTVAPFDRVSSPVNEAVPSARL